MKLVLDLHQNFSSKNDAKQKAKIFVSPVIRKFMKDERFCKNLTVLKKEAWASFVWWSITLLDTINLLHM